MGEQRCLHCDLLRTIVKYHEDCLPGGLGGALVLDGDLVLTHLARVAGEMFAAIESPALRAEALTEFAREMCGHAKECLESGDHFQSANTTFQ